jgi:hypothetical protein
MPRAGLLDHVQRQTTNRVDRQPLQITLNHRAQLPPGSPNNPSRVNSRAALREDPNSQAEREPPAPLTRPAIPFPDKDGNGYAPDRFDDTPRLALAR